MKILQYNIQSLKKTGNKETLEFYLNQNNFDAALLSETWLEDNSSTSMRNYNFIGRFRDDGYGGVGIYLKNNIRFSINRMVTNCEAISVTTRNLAKNFNLVSLYLPHDEVQSEIDKIMKFFENSNNITIIGGDFNTHSAAWGDNFTDSKGLTLEAVIQNFGYNILNDGSGTFCGPQRESAIDLTLISRDHLSFTWRTLNIKLSGSNHKPIVIESDTPTLKKIS